LRHTCARSRSDSLKSVLRRNSVTIGSLAGRTAVSARGTSRSWRSVLAPHARCPGRRPDTRRRDAAFDARSRGDRRGRHLRPDAAAAGQQEEVRRRAADPVVRADPRRRGRSPARDVGRVRARPRQSTVRAQRRRSHRAAQPRQPASCGPTTASPPNRWVTYNAHIADSAPDLWAAARALIADATKENGWFAE
jgi:hypothetical protein